MSHQEAKHEEHKHEPAHEKAPLVLDLHREPAAEHKHDAPKCDAVTGKEYFHNQTPHNIIDGINGTEYNFVKGAVAGTTLVITAPFTGAVDGATGAQSFGEAVGGACVGFGRGLVRSVVGGPALLIAGAVSGANQLKKGVIEAADAPGQGHGVAENWKHIVEDQSFINLATNVAPSSYTGEEGKYEFFLTEEPKNFVQGLGHAQYNAGKGFISGATLAVSAPIVDTIKGFGEGIHDPNGGFEGAVKGLGAGVARGLVGGFTLAAAGVTTGAVALGRGFCSLDNLPQAVDAFDATTNDFNRLLRAPISELVLPAPRDHALPAPEHKPQGHAQQ